VLAVCDSLKTVTVDPENPRYHAVGNCLIETAAKVLVAGCNNSVIPDDGSVEIIETFAFHEMYYMDQLVIPEGVTTIRHLAVERCSFTALQIPSTVTSIAPESFGKCYDITELRVSEANPVYHAEGNCLIETRKKRMIYGNSHSVIPVDGSVEIIGEFAFANQVYLDRMVIPEGIRHIETGAIAFSSLREVVLPASLESIRPDAFLECDNLDSIISAPNGRVYYSVENCLIERRSGQLVIGCRNSMIPDDGSIRSIGEMAFFKVPLTGVNLPEGITSLGHKSFADTQLTEVNLPLSINDINITAFESCTRLKTITIPDNHPKLYVENDCLIEDSSDVLIIGGIDAEIPQDGSVRAINSHAFFGRSIQRVDLPDELVFLGDSTFTLSSLQTVRIPRLIDVIRAHSFSECFALESIYIPKSVSQIETNAFRQCPELRTVYYSGSEEDWNRIVVMNGNEALQNAEIRFRQSVGDYEEDMES